MCKSLFLFGAFLLLALGGHAQTSPAPFLKIVHLGTEGRPIIDLYLTPQEPTPNAAQGIDGRYIFQSVCVVTAAEFTALLHYTQGYTTRHQPDSKDTKYGTLELTLGAPQPAPPLVYTRPKAVAFLEGAAQVLQKQSAGPDKSEAVRRLEATTRRLTGATKQPSP